MNSLTPSKEVREAEVTTSDARCHWLPIWNLVSPGKVGIMLLRKWQVYVKQISRYRFRRSPTRTWLSIGTRGTQSHLKLLIVFFSNTKKITLFSTLTGVIQKKFKHQNSIFGRIIQTSAWMSKYWTDFTTTSIMNVYVLIYIIADLDFIPTCLEKYLQRGILRKINLNDI